jgi:C-terminal processing protease CtpA/Prc
VATDRARLGDQQNLEADGRFQQRAEIRSTEDLGLQVTERQNGLAIMDIDRSSVLIDSGLQPGDVLLSVRNRPLRDRVQFVSWLRTLEPGVRVPVQIIRDGRRETIYVTGIDFDRWQRRDRGWYESGADGGAYLGVVFDDRYPSMAVVEIVRRNTAAERSGLRPGDVIRRINGQRVNGMNHASALIGQMQPGDEVDIEFSRRTSGQAIARLGARPDSRQTTYYEGEDYSSYDGETTYYDDRPTTRYSEGIQTFEDDGRMRDDVRFGERDRFRERGPVRRALTRPFRNP